MLRKITYNTEVLRVNFGKVTYNFDQETTSIVDWISINHYIRDIKWYTAVNIADGRRRGRRIRA